jgi:hypothetical protein
MIPNLIGRSKPVMMATTPGMRRPAEASTLTIRACGVCARRILQCSMRGRLMSSA